VPYSFALSGYASLLPVVRRFDLGDTEAGGGFPLVNRLPPKTQMQVRWALNPSLLRRYIGIESAGSRIYFVSRCRLSVTSR
jgi:hypothetical protein